MYSRRHETYLDHEPRRIPPVVEDLRAQNMPTYSPHGLVLLLGKPSSRIVSQGSVLAGTPFQIVAKLVVNENEKYTNPTHW